MTLNAADYLEDCIRSVISQDFKDLEYIVIDGASTDGTTDIARKYSEHIHYYISEKDESQYDALNKGIAMATGDVIGILNADDYFPHPGVISRIADVFSTTGSDVVYGDLDYVSRDRSGKITRKWRSGAFNPKRLEWGWMPPHPTWYVRKDVLERSGTYRRGYSSSADYELILRIMRRKTLTCAYLPEVLVKMRAGGESNSSLGNRLRAVRSDFKAIRDNHVRFPTLVTLVKRLIKIPQYFR